MKLTVLPTECDCIRCSLMCHAPCCGTPDDMEKLMDAGYGNRLMFDDLPGGEVMLKPSLKGFEGKQTPWETFSVKGCTFWKEGKCELHSLGLKPTLGKLAIHDQSEEDRHQVAQFIEESWKGKKAKKTLKRWKKLTGYIEGNPEQGELIQEELNLMEAVILTNLDILVKELRKA